MSREIKFRLWHTEDKQMYSYDFMWGRSGRSGSGWVDCVPFGEEREVGFFKQGNQIGIDPNDCEIMQYTGLKDKNGKEIYEGDIVSFLGGNWMDDELTQKIGAVEWNEELLKFDVVTPDKGAIPDLRKSYDDNKFEVIGNIYETPELIAK